MEQWRVSCSHIFYSKIVSKYNIGYLAMSNRYSHDVQQCDAFKMGYEPFLIWNSHVSKLCYSDAQVETVQQNYPIIPLSFFYNLVA